MPKQVVYIRRERDGGSEAYYFRTRDESTGPLDRNRLLKRLKQYRGYLPRYEGFVPGGVQNDIKRALGY